MPTTIERRHMAARIDARIRQLDTLELLEVDIIKEMAEYMPDFHHLMMNASRAEMDALCEKFSGFYRFAKIIETLASGIASGKVKVPGGRTTSEEDRLAAAIDLRVRQLEATGKGGVALLEHMAGYILDLQRIWSTTSDESLSLLCRKYPGLYRYGILMEEAAEAESKKTTTNYSHLPKLPVVAKTIVAQLLTQGATLEREFQTVLDAHKQRDMWLETEVLVEHYQQWVEKLVKLPDTLRAAGVPEASYAIQMHVFAPMAQRIEHLQKQVVNPVAVSQNHRC